MEVLQNTRKVERSTGVSAITENDSSPTSSSAKETLQSTSISTRFQSCTLFLFLGATVMVVLLGAAEVGKMWGNGLGSAAHFMSSQASLTDHVKSSALPLNPLYSMEVDDEERSKGRSLRTDDYHVEADTLRGLQEEGHEMTIQAGKTSEAPTRCILANTDLLLPLHSRDMPFAPLLFKSIDLNVPCYHDLIIIVPPESIDEIKTIAPPWAKIYAVEEPLPERLGYISQQIIKIYADKFVMEGAADHVLILEADMIFAGWDDKCYYSPETNKLRVFCVDYSGEKAAAIWQRGTEHALGFSVNIDCVVATPFMYPTKVFPMFRNHIKHVHGNHTSFGEFVTAYFEGHTTQFTGEQLLFSEFNMLNHFMLRHLSNEVELIMEYNKQDGERDVRFDDMRVCAKHVGSEVVRDDLMVDNPKLTFEYFEKAYRYLERPVERTFVKLDLTL